MRIIRGHFDHHINPTAIMVGWHQRFASAGAPEAILETNGTAFQINYSPSWDVNSLKHSFGLEVHRIDSACEIAWLTE